MILDDLLKTCLRIKSIYYSYDDFSKLLVSKDEIEKLLTSVPSLFDINSNGDYDKQITIAIKLKACEDYNNSFKICFDKDDCDNFHICERKFSFEECKDMTCKLVHNFNTKHNQKILKENNLEAKSIFLMEFFKVMIIFNVEICYRNQNSI